MRLQTLRLSEYKVEGLWLTDCELKWTVKNTEDGRKYMKLDGQQYTKLMTCETGRAFEQKLYYLNFRY